MSKRVKIKNIEPFASCVEFPSDSFWKNIFQNAAMGKFPRGFTYRNGIISYKRNGKIYRTLEVSPDPIETFNSVVKFLQECGNMYSTRDVAETYRASNTEIVFDWANLKKQMKYVCIANFVEDYNNVNNLPRALSDELTFVLKMGLQNNAFTNDDIVFDSRRIVKIKNLKYDPEFFETRGIDSIQKFPNGTVLETATTSRGFLVDYKKKNKAQKKTSQKKQESLRSLRSSVLWYMKKNLGSLEPATKSGMTSMEKSSDLSSLS